MNSNRLRFGVLSTARIGVEKVIPAMQRGAHTEVVAIASRDSGRAKAAASRLGIPKWFGSYEELLASADVDAVYNPLPNDLHVPWSIHALRAGKHVLCEKPIALSVSDGRKLAAAAREYPQLKVMEAFMYKHHPQWQLVYDLVCEGKIGRLRTIQTFFSYFNVDAGNIRNKVENGGGALLDIGCYPISLSRLLFNAEPQRVAALIDRDGKFGTDRITSAVLDFGSGTSTFTCSTQLAPFQRVWIHGDSARIEIEIPFNAPPDRPCKVLFQKGSAVEEIVLPVADQYTLQGDHFAQAVAQNSQVSTPVADALANMGVIDAVFASARSGKWETPRAPVV